MKKRRKWPWIAKQRWDDLLFMHWPVPYDVLRPHVPEALELETYDGQAWISIIPFYASKNRLRGMPCSIPFSAYLELNIRTYVTFNDEPGVYFFALDANNKLAVAGARGLFSLPYFNATMNFTRKHKQITFESQRDTGDTDGGTTKVLSVNYRPFSPIYHAKENTLTHWLTERYCLYTFKGNKLLKGPITHQPWKLQDVELSIETNEVVNFLPQTYFLQKPIVHYSKTKKAHFHPFESMGKFPKAVISAK